MAHKPKYSKCISPKIYIFHKVTISFYKFTFSFYIILHHKYFVQVFEVVFVSYLSIKKFSDKSVITHFLTRIENFIYNYSPINTSLLRFPIRIIKRDSAWLLEGSAKTDRTMYILLALPMIDK